MSADVQSSPKVVDQGGRVQSGPKAAAGMPHHRRTSGRIQQQRRAATASTGSGLGQKDKKPANFHHHHNNNNSRKRSQSFSGGGGGGATVGGVAKGGGVANAQGVGGGGGGKMFPAYKRRKKDHIVPPTKFLLGGNICDPLNLNSLLDEDINRAMNAVTPKSSPLPTPKHRKGEVEVIIPPNINDPLNLLQMSADGEEDCDYEKSLISPVKGGAGPGLGKKNKRKRRHTKSFSQDAGGVAVASAASDSRLQEPDKPEAGAGGSAVYTSAMEAASLTRHSALGQSDLQPVPTFSLPSPLAERVETDKTKKITPIGVSVGDSATTQSTVTTPTNTSSTLASSAAVTGPTTNSPTTTKSAVTSVSGVGGAETVVAQGGGAKPVTSSGGGIFKKCRKDSKDKIVSPAIPQPGAWGDKGHHHHHHRFRPHQLTPHIDKNQKTPNFKEVNTRFRYGNYNRYYGYRNPSNTHNNHHHQQQQQQHVDPRLKVLLRRRDLFEGRDVLDIGCNVGHVTLAVARDTNPKSIVGIDIDRQLVDAAKRNVKHYVKSGAGLVTGVAGGSDSCGVGGRLMAYPRAMPAIYGPLDAPPDKGHSRFPYNVSFVQGNYVLDSDALLSLDSTRCQFDTILCLSVTKWFHLNWGDGGLKRAFRRMYAQLRPGGKLILEPQPWHSYKKKRNLTPEIWENYKSIELFPHKFSQFLLSDVGFTKCELVGTPHHHSKGFQRPIKLFTKGELNSAPSSVRLTGVTSPEADVVISLDGNSAAKTSVGEGNSTVTSLKDDVVMSEGNNVTKTLSGEGDSTVTSLKDDKVISSDRNNVTKTLSGEGNSTETLLKDDEVISSERNDVTEILSGEGNSTITS